MISHAKTSLDLRYKPANVLGPPYALRKVEYPATNVCSKVDLKILGWIPTVPF
jgi:hypothetical protein